MRKSQSASTDRKFLPILSARRRHSRRRQRNEQGVVAVDFTAVLYMGLPEKSGQPLFESKSRLEDNGRAEMKEEKSTYACDTILVEESRNS